MQNLDGWQTRIDHESLGGIICSQDDLLVAFPSRWNSLCITQYPLRKLGQKRRGLIYIELLELVCFADSFVV